MEKENNRPCDDCGALTNPYDAFIPLGDDKIFCENCCPLNFGGDDDNL